MQSPLQQLLPALVRSFADNRKQIWILNSNKSKKDDGFCSRNLFMHKIFISKADQIYLLDIRYAEVCFFFPNLQLNEVTGLHHRFFSHCYEFGSKKRYAVSTCILCTKHKEGRISQSIFYPETPSQDPFPSLFLFWQTPKPQKHGLWRWKWNWVRTRGKIR